MASRARIRRGIPDSKLTAPAPSAFYVRRDALYARLDEAFGRRLTTVVAGPGFGKSTSIAAWSADTVCAWCTLDRGDGSLSRLAVSLAEALRRPVPSLTDEFAAAVSQEAVGT